MQPHLLPVVVGAVITAFFGVRGRACSVLPVCLPWRPCYRMAAGNGGEWEKYNGTALQWQFACLGAFATGRPPQADARAARQAAAQQARQAAAAVAAEAAK